MAIENPLSKRLSLVFTKGTDPETGNPIRSTQSISKIKTTASSDDLLNVANSVSGLLAYPLYDVQVVTTVELLEG